MRASSAIAVIRSAASVSAGVPCAAETSGLMAPPSTTMPAGGRPPSVQAGKRCSSGRISALPIGVSPMMAISTMLIPASRPPRRRKRVAISTTPISPRMMIRLDGSAKKPRILARTKNIGAAAHFFFSAS